MPDSNNTTTRPLTAGEIWAKHKDDVPQPAVLPSPALYAHFSEFVIWSDLQDNGSFLGYCPMHDAARSTPGSAEFTFLKGAMRCHGDPSCHPGKRAMSLQNVINRLRNGG